MKLPAIHPPVSRNGCAAVGQGVPTDSHSAMELYGKQNRSQAARPDPLKTSNLAQERAATRIAASLDYMLAHLNQPIRISQLCAITGFSPSSFFVFFKCATGDTPLNWFTKMRMQWASELLCKSNFQIKKIAGQVGYEDPLYFSRLFKSVHGIAPKEYRAQTQKATSRLVKERKSISNL